MSLPHWGDADDLVRLVDVQPDGAGAFNCPLHVYAARNVVEGSQLLAQAVVAAAKTVPHQRIVSAHMIFSRAAAFDLPLTFRAEVLKPGRTFSTVEVRAEQEGRLIGPALLLADSGAPDTLVGQVAMPDVPPPQDCPAYDYGMTGRDVRFVNGDYAPEEDRVGPPELNAWVRFHRAPASPLLHQALLTQFVGHMTIAAAMLPHPDVKESEAHVTLSTGIMAITIAFHHDADVSQWLLYSNPAIFSGRGLVQGEGHVFTQDGRLAASYTVQGMVRGFGTDPASLGMDKSQLM